MRANVRLLAGSISLAAVVCWLLVCAVATTTAHAPIGHDANARDRIVLSQALPKLHGENLKVTIVEVTYGPGESSRPHSHPCPVTVYIVQGSLRSKVKGEPEKIYQAGESFYEAPNGVHEVSANASQTVPAKFVAYFVCDHDVPLSGPPANSNQGEQP